MFTIDLTLKNTPMTVSVEKKDAAVAEEIYGKIIEAMRSIEPQLVELTCDKQTDKKIAVFSDQISAVIVSQKSGSASAGKTPGFFASSNAQ